jgi:hypothetical protein
MKFLPAISPDDTRNFTGTFDYSYSIGYHEHFTGRKISSQKLSQLEEKGTKQQNKNNQRKIINFIESCKHLHHNGTTQCFKFKYAFENELVGWLAG